MKTENEIKKVERKKGRVNGQVTQIMTSFRVDADVVDYLKSKPNRGRYLNDLVRTDMMNNSTLFDDSDISVIRDSMLELIELQPKASANDERLAIINACQKRDFNPTFASVEQLLNNTSNTWTEFK